MTSQNTPDPQRLRDFFYWINERHRIYLKRLQGESKPWTLDPVLQTGRFTNYDRQLDRVTQFYTDWISPHLQGSKTDLITNTALFRLTNWPDTITALGYQTPWDRSKSFKVLDKLSKQGIQIFTNAYIIRGFPGMSKHQSICDVVQMVHEQSTDILKVTEESRSLEVTHQRLTQIPLIGGFLGYEIVSDLRHTPVLSGAVDILMWANAGPGAKRGLSRVFLDANTNDVNQCNQMMYDLLELSPQYLEEHIPKPLEMRDIEHSLCEFDKYIRVRDDGGRTRNKYPGA